MNKTNNTNLMFTFYGHIKNWAPPVVFFILILLVWSAVIKIFDVPSYIAPSPVDVGASISKNARHLLEQTGITMAEAVLGFLVANICGIALSIAFVHSRAVERSVYPYTIALKAVPLVAIAPLLTLWFGTGFLGKVIMAATISFFPIIVNATIGLKSVDPEALHLMRSLSASRLQILLKLRLPSSLPYIFSGLKISSTLSVIGAIVAELAGAKQGIGYVILIASYQYETVKLFAAIIAISLGGILFFGLISLIERYCLRWHESNRPIA